MNQKFQNYTNLAVYLVDLVTLELDDRLIHQLVRIFDNPKQAQNQKLLS